MGASGSHANEVATFNDYSAAALTIDGRINRAGLIVKLHTSLIEY